MTEKQQQYGGPEGMIFGVPEWVGQLVGSTSNLIQTATLTFSNEDFARLKMEAVVAADEGTKVLMERLYILGAIPTPEEDAEAIQAAGEVAP